MFKQKSKTLLFLQFLYGIAFTIFYITGIINFMKLLGITSIISIIIYWIAAIVLSFLAFIFTFMQLSKLKTKHKGRSMLIVLHIATAILVFYGPKVIENNNYIASLPPLEMSFGKAFIYEDKYIVAVTVSFKVVKPKSSIVILSEFQREIENTLRTGATQKAKNKYLANIKNKEKLKEILKKYSAEFQDYLVQKNPHSEIQDIQVESFIYKN